MLAFPPWEKTKRSSFIRLLAWLVLSTSRVLAQAVDGDKIDFTTLDGWIDLRSCLQGCFTGYGAIQNQVGCQTNVCLCRASTLGEAVPEVANKAFSDCSNLDDKTSAISVLTAYCAGKGYTSIISPTLLSSETGARTPYSCFLSDLSFFGLQ
jgi:hypothetical protein